MFVKHEIEIWPVWVQLKYEKNPNKSHETGPVLKLLILLSFISGRKSSSVFFALHFFYGAGALIAPILAKPFLKGKNTLLFMNIFSYFSCHRTMSSYSPRSYYS